MAHTERKGGMLEMWLEKEMTQDKKIIYVENLSTKKKKKPKYLQSSPWPSSHSVIP